jgi:hypothetical protein
MMPEADDQRQSPFHGFINDHLDMNGVDGVCFETIALAVHQIMRDLPADPTGESWECQLDRLQQTLTMCLSIEATGRLIQDHPQLIALERHELELIVRLALTLAFSSYNDLAQRLGYEPEQMHRDRQRLWLTLRSAMGYVSKAAKSGDPVARRLLEDTRHVLDDTRPVDWVNRTTTLDE